MCPVCWLLSIKQVSSKMELIFSVALTGFICKMFKCFILKSYIFNFVNFSYLLRCACVFQFATVLFCISVEKLYIPWCEYLMNPCGIWINLHMRCHPLVFLPGDPTTQRKVCYECVRGLFKNSQKRLRTEMWNLSMYSSISFLPFCWDKKKVT